MNTALEQPVIDSRSPWLGLASFTEETRAWFFGREEEVAELARRVQRKLLTVLFGQSGLGKTSILRAGLVPKLRELGYCPVYVRIDYAPDAPAPAEQIKQAIAQAARGAGEWTRAGVAEAGESLWEFLHHRDDVLRDAKGQTLIPFLIFDQFEEIFTLAQSDDAGRARATRFIQELADLVENRPPAEFEARLDRDENAAEGFDFARSDYRVLIALREDYLAPLESLKRSMPSIAQNRLRLAPMNGQQALAAVLKPGRGLVNQEVAEAIVRFVAGGAELANAEVEPALLSLVCRELNDARIAAGRSEISPDLLKGSQDTILSNFYTRSLADQPDAVRRVIEDQLLTASGFRENIAEERLLAAFKAAGVPSETLALLVNRRLLRVEDRLDLRRVELTHDVLCGVVKASRDLRQEREAREAADRALAEQRERELAARRALLRARKIASGCALLAVVAVAAAVVAVFSTLRARRIEAAEQQARTQSESLVGYLSDDFAYELETYGQLSMISEISRRQMQYFDGLPQELKGRDSIRNGALAMVHFARAERQMGHNDPARQAARRAIALLEQARKDGDTTDGTTVALARSYTALSRVLSVEADPEVYAMGAKGLQLVEPMALRPQASVSARRAYGEALTELGYDESFQDAKIEMGVKHLRQARAVATSLGAENLKSLEAGSLYVSAAVWEQEGLARLGQVDEARALAAQADELARKILQQRPDFRQVLHDAEVLESDVGGYASTHLDIPTAMHYFELAWQLSQVQLQQDPDNTSSINNASVNRLMLNSAAWQQGDIAASFDYYRQAVEIFRRVKQQGTWYVLNSLGPLAQVGQNMADAGQVDKAREQSAVAAAAVEKLKQTEPAGSNTPVLAECTLRFIQANISLGLEDFKAARDQAIEARRPIAGIKPNAPFEGFMKFNCDYSAPLTEGEADLWLGNYGAANDAYAVALKSRVQYPMGDVDERRVLSIARLMKGMALVHLGKVDEARALITPEVTFQKGLIDEDKGDVTEFVDWARTLYIESLVEPARGTALRAEALRYLDRLPPGFSKLHSTVRWRKLIQRGN